MPRAADRRRSSRAVAGGALPQLNRRAAGCLLHPTSLPGPHGCGDFGPAAYAFADFLAAAKLRWWQVLPLGPVGPGDSPYASPSAFAGSELLISLEALRRDGWLSAREIAPIKPATRADRVQYAATGALRTARLRRAYDRFRANRAVRTAAFERFRHETAAWIDDWTLFRALSRAQGTDDWTRWPRELRDRDQTALARARADLADEIGYDEFVQFAFDRQWQSLRAYCRRIGVGLIGDVPIFVVHGSADVWACPRLFELDSRGRPTVVSGVPPDYFSRTGQLWGHPLYRWSAHEAEDFAWWMERFRAAARCFDAVRIDHFLGFHRCWAVPATHRTAMRGRYRPSPGVALLERLRSEQLPIEIIAEDLGAVTPEAAALRDRFELPGMRILQFGLGGARHDQPQNYERRCVAYTGTHDNETLVGWFRSARRDRRIGADGLSAGERAARYLGSTRDVNWHAIRALYQSVADLVVFPAQDLLGLDNRARMNTPGVPRGNWRWRLGVRALRPALAERIAQLAETFER